MPPAPNALTITDAPRDALRSTIDELQRGLPFVPLDSAASRIESWRLHLAGTDRTDLHAVADELAQLASLLDHPERDGDRIGQSLARLGAQTVAAAQQTETAEISRAVERLGTLLLHAGHALRGPRPL